MLIKGEVRPAVRQTKVQKCGTTKLRSVISVISFLSCFIGCSYWLTFELELSWNWACLTCLSWTTAWSSHWRSWCSGSDSYGFTCSAGHSTTAFAGTPTSTSSTPSTTTTYILLSVWPDGQYQTEPAEKAELGAHPQREGRRKKERVERGSNRGGWVPHRSPFSGWTLWAKGQQTSGQKQHPETQVCSVAL